MKKDHLILTKMTDCTYQSIFTNNHGRKIYLKVYIAGEVISILNCYYIDRPQWGSVKTTPQKQKNKQCRYTDFLNVLAEQLDKRFYGIEFSDNELFLRTEEFVSMYLQNRRKLKFLVFFKYDGTLKTIIKNRTHRVISLEIKLSKNQGVISQCFYCDKKYKRQHHYVTPYSLNTISFEYSKKNILKIVNEELNGDFTDVIITEDSTLNIDENLIPVCGSI